MLSLRNIVKAASGSLASKFATATTTLLLIRLLPESEYASFTIIFTISSLIYTASGPALNKIFLISKNETSLKQPHNFFVTQLTIAILLSVILLPLAAYNKQLYILANTLAIAKSAADFPKNTYQRDMQFGKVALIESIQSISPLILLLLFSWLGTQQRPTSTTAISVFTIGSLITFSIFAQRLTPFDFSKLKSDLLATLHHLRFPHAYIFLYSITLSIYGQIDIFLLKYLHSDIDVATFGTALKYYGLLTLLAASISSVYLPTITNAPKNSPLRPFYKKHLLISTPICAMIVISSFTATIWIPMIDGGKYPNSIICYNILSFSALASVVLNPFSSVLLRQGKYGFLYKSALSCLLVGFAVRYFLIKEFNSTGASISTALSITSLNTLYFIHSLKRRNTTK